MKKLLSLFGALVLLGASAYAQTTAVSATVTDTDGTVWANGVWHIQFVPSPNNPNINAYNINGTPLDPAVLNQQGNMNGSGAFSVSVYQQAPITPVGSSWKLSVCPNAITSCGIYTFTAVGSSINLSSALTPIIPAPRFHPVAGAYGYNDAEAILQLIPGSTYWNVTSNSARCYTGSPASTWGDCNTGGGGGNTCTTPGIFNVSCPAYGAKGDTVNISGCSIASTDGTNTLTCNAGSFPTSAVVGDIVQIFGSGTGSGTPTQDGSIMTWISTSQVTLSTTAGTTVSGATGKYGHNDTAAITAAITDACAAGIGTVYLPPGFDSMVAPTTYDFTGTNTYNLSIPCNNITLGSQSPGATIEADGAAHQGSGICVRGRGVEFGWGSNPTNDNMVWIKLNGNTSGNTHVSQEPANPGSGCDGWDLSNQGVVYGGSATNTSINHDDIGYFKGEGVYGSGSTMSITNSKIHDSNAEGMSIYSTNLDVEHNEFYQFYTNAAENSITYITGAVTRYVDNYVHDSATGFDLLGTSLAPTATTTLIENNVFQNIGIGLNNHGSNYLSALVFGSQFTPGVVGQGGYVARNNTFIDNANGVTINGIASPWGSYGVEITNSTFMLDAFQGGTLFNIGDALSNVTINGVTTLRSPNAANSGLGFNTAFTIAGGPYTNFVIENVTLDSAAFSGNPAIWGQDHLKDWSIFSGQVPLWKNIIWAGTPPEGQVCNQNVIWQCINPSSPTVYPGLDSAFLLVMTGTTAATVIGGKNLDGQEFLLTVASGSTYGITLTTDSNQIIDGGPITLNAGDQVKFVYAQATGKWVLQRPAAASGGITQLTGDVTAGPGSGSQAATLTAVGSAGSCGDATHSCTLTFDTKGRETAQTNTAISLGSNKIVALWNGASGTMVDDGEGGSGYLSGATSWGTTISGTYYVNCYTGGWPSGSSLGQKIVVIALGYPIDGTTFTYAVDTPTLSGGRGNTIPSVTCMAIQ